MHAGRICNGKLREKQVWSLNFHCGRNPAREPVAHSLRSALLPLVAEQLGDPCRATKAGNHETVGFNPGGFVHA